MQSASLAALFGMGFAIDGERWTQTLSAVLATPANRAALFLGRALPVLVNAAVTAATGFVGGALLLGFRMPWSARARDWRCSSCSRRSRAPDSAC